MPYDPRPISEGGNRGIDESFSRKAPCGKFRIIAVDTFDGGDWIEGDFDTLGAAIKHSNERTKGKQMLKMHIYDDTGTHREQAGSF